MCRTAVLNELVQCFMIDSKFITAGLCSVKQLDNL